MFDSGSTEFNNSLLENVSTTAPITIQDAIMGTGKSTYIIEKFTKLAEDGRQHDEPYLVILPYLTEIDRYETACPGMHFEQPLKDADKRKKKKVSTIGQTGEDVEVTVPVCTRAANGATTKTEDLKILLANGSNILSTHSMFDQWDEEIALLIRDGKYHVIMDEEVQAMSNLTVKLGPGDRRELLALGYISVDEDTRKVSWDFSASDDPDGKYTGNAKFKSIRNHCKAGNLYMLGELSDDGQPLFIWTVPEQFFRVAQSYTILTYMFECSELAAFFKLNNLKPNIERPDMQRQQKIMKDAKELISIIDAPKTVEQETAAQNSFSNGWYERCSSDAMKKIRLAAGDALRRKYKVDKDQLMWTCPSTYSDAKERKGKSHMVLRGYAGQHVPWNCKGTNDYAGRDTVVYLMNVYQHVVIKRYLKANDIAFDEDGYALSSLLQFIWRSAIRKGKPIRVMIPNPRMRNLFKDWLDSI